MNLRALIQLSTNVSQVVCSFNGGGDQDNTFNKGSELIEECLDMLSIIKGINLVTKYANTTSYVWWPKDGKCTLQIECSFIHNLNVEMSLQLESRDSSGNIIPITQVAPEYHKALRFFRFSQVTDNLYDAYRNMYLSFELILSAYNPISQNERESSWIKRVMSDVNNEIQILDYIGMQDKSVDYFFQTIYKNARCKLFHAKSGMEHFLPIGDVEERENISKALMYLSRCVLRLLHERCDITRNQGMRLSSRANESTLNDMFRGCSLVLSDFSDVGDDYVIPTNCIRIPSDIAIHNEFAKISCHVDYVDALSDLPLRSILLSKGENIDLCIGLDKTIYLTGVDILCVAINIELTNGNSLKQAYMH